MAVKKWVNYKNIVQFSNSSCDLSQKCKIFFILNFSYILGFGYYFKILKLVNNLSETFLEFQKTNLINFLTFYLFKRIIIFYVLKYNFILYSVVLLINRSTMCHTSC